MPVAHSAPQKPAAIRVDVVESLETQTSWLSAKPAIQFSTERSPSLTIRVDETTRYQVIDGFGASLTDSSAWLLDKKLTPEKRLEALASLFDPQKGIGLSILRQPMGASDFA